MADEPRSKIIQENPIGKGLGAFRASFNSVCKDTGTACSPGALEQLSGEDLQNLALDLLSALRNLPAIRQLASRAGLRTLRNDLLKLISAVASDDFDLDRVKPLLKSALADDLDDALIWDKVYTPANSIVSQHEQLRELLRIPPRRGRSP